MARSAALLVIGVALLAIVAQLLLGFPYADLGGTDWGADLRGYVEASRSWLAGDGFYLPRQLHGPYQIELGDVLYPPTALYLFIPFLVLPYQLWWVLAVGLLGYVVWSWRPALWAVASILVCLAFPNQPVLYFRGAPVIVFAALVAAALRWKWPGALILLEAIDTPVRADRHPDPRLVDHGRDPGGPHPATHPDDPRLAADGLRRARS